MNIRKRVLFVSLLISCLFFVSLSKPSLNAQPYERTTVYQVQKRLQELGYDPGNLDGILGKKTESALEKYQSDNNLPTTKTLDPQTIEKLELKTSSSSKPANLIKKDIKNTLGYRWEIRSVEIENEILVIITNFDYIKIKGFLSMIPWVCVELYKYPILTDRLREIRILNRSENQGWVLLEPRMCDEIAHASLNELDDLVTRVSDKFRP